MSRAEYKRIVVDLRQAEATSQGRQMAWEAMLTDANRRYGQLVIEYHALRMAATLTAKPPTPDRAAQQKHQADHLQQLILASVPVGARGPALRQLALDRAAGKDDLDIQRAIEQGDESDGVPG